MPESQPDLFSAGEQRVVTKLEAIRQRWLKFDSANPQVKAALIRRALKLKRQGIKRFGIQSLMGVVRYIETRKRIDTDEEFAINNSFSPLYSRAIMNEVPELEGFFETRDMTSARQSTTIITETRTAE